MRQYVLFFVFLAVFWSTSQAGAVTRGFCISGTGNGTDWTWTLSGEYGIPTWTTTVDAPDSGANAGELAEAWVNSINKFGGSPPIFEADFLGMSDGNGYFTVTAGFSFSFKVGSCTIGSTGCSFNPTVSEGVFPAFERGDADDSGSVNVSDATYISNYLFSGGSAPACDDAADANDDGSINLSDIAYINNYLFSSGPAPPAPGPTTCGGDPTTDSLGCSSSTDCQ